MRNGATTIAMCAQTLALTGCDSLQAAYAIAVGETYLDGHVTDDENSPRIVISNRNRASALRAALKDCGKPLSSDPAEIEFSDEMNWDELESNGSRPMVIVADAKPYFYRCPAPGKEKT